MSQLPNFEFLSRVLLLENLQSPSIGSLSGESRKIFDIGIQDALISLGIFAVALVLGQVIGRSLLKAIGNLSSKTKSRLDDRFTEVLSKPLTVGLMLLAFYLASLSLPLDESAKSILSKIFVSLSTLIGTWFLLRCTRLIADLVEELPENISKNLLGLIPLVQRTLQFAIVLIAGIMVLDEFGYNVQGLLAAMGIGGIALAYAAQDTIKNIFGTLMLVLDRPFDIGDRIDVGDISGNVESIGLRSTKVRSLSQVLIAVPNSVLANEQIENWNKSSQRRVRQVIGLTYDTSAEQLKGLTQDISDILTQDSDVETQSKHIRFKDFGDSALELLVLYRTQNGSWSQSLETQERVNYAIMQAVEARGLSFAFPTQTIHLKNETE